MPGPPAPPKLPDWWVWLASGGGGVMLGAALKELWKGAGRLLRKFSGLEYKREEAQDAATASLRSEFRERLTTLELRVETVRAESDQWHTRYWQEVEAHVKTKGENETLRAQVAVYRDEQSALLGRISSLERQVHALQGDAGHSI